MQHPVWAHCQRGRVQAGGHGVGTIGNIVRAPFPAPIAGDGTDNAIGIDASDIASGSDVDTAIRAELDIGSA